MICLDTPYEKLIYPEKHEIFTRNNNENRSFCSYHQYKDVYITMLPGNDFRDVANKAKELVQNGFNPVPHFPARSIKNQNELKDYCKYV